MRSLGNWQVRRVIRGWTRGSDFMMLYSMMILFQPSLRLMLKYWYSLWSGQGRMGDGSERKWVVGGLEGELVRAKVSLSYWFV